MNCDEVKVVKPSDVVNDVLQTTGTVAAHEARFSVASAEVQGCEREVFLRFDLSTLVPIIFMVAPHRSTRALRRL